MQHFSFTFVFVFFSSTVFLIFLDVRSSMYLLVQKFIMYESMCDGSVLIMKYIKVVLHHFCTCFPLSNLPSDLCLTAQNLGPKSELEASKCCDLSVL